MEILVPFSGSKPIVWTLNSLYLYKYKGMKTLVIQSKNPSEIKFLSDLLKKLGVDAKWMDAEEIEDLGMSILMNQTNRKKKVSRDVIMKKLNA
jgi:hypothetical protein